MRCYIDKLLLHSVMDFQLFICGLQLTSPIIHSELQPLVPQKHQKHNSKCYRGNYNYQSGTKVLLLATQPVNVACKVMRSNDVHSQKVLAVNVNLCIGYGASFPFCGISPIPLSPCNELFITVLKVFLIPRKARMKGLTVFRFQKHFYP